MPDPIKHVVVLMLENRSFDQMLGALHPLVDGVDPAAPGVNHDKEGRPYRQQPIKASSFAFDPRHEWEHVERQLADGNRGFVLDFEEAYAGKATPDDYPAIMNYFARGEAHALHTLAEHFTVCDRWFSSVPGPTWANRFFVHSGTSLGRVKMGALHFLGYDQETIYNQLDQKGVTWAIYAGDIAQAALFEQLWERIGSFHLSSSFYRHAARAESDFPQYVFIEPRYYFPHVNDDHPPASVTRAQELVASVYNAIRANEELWRTTLLVVLYDEHGGFFDHVIPPGATSPDGLHQEGCDFKQLGVRVPAVFVSPWVEKGRVFGRNEGTHFDHTSLLRYLADKWGLEPLRARTAEANSFASIITSTMRTDAPQSIIMPSRAVPMMARAPAPAEPPALNENQEGLAAFMEHMGREPPTKARAMRAQIMSAAAPTPPDPQTAKANFQHWLATFEQDDLA